ncbi:unnamed protein product [Parascedosporium putredinis]|uniref:Uncharacterized protein n=1 Tax=Parascedosporium putredinis TaxID=1442378 RepID=A0A9P1H130_9PEZI|nr:unnamed protein product [Parascedosporium putredinis]CAI7993267.1 unnamed protein product [Parascedosporium putredinis]
MGLINLMISSVLLTQGVKWGVGMHFEDMVLDNIPKVAEFSYAAGFATILGTAWSKTSFGITLLRISDVISDVLLCSGIMSFMKIIKLNEISDVRATTVDLKILGIAELAITIIAVSIPVLRAFIRRRSTSEGKASFVHMSQLPSIDREIRGQRKKAVSTQARFILMKLNLEKLDQALHNFMFNLATFSF